MLSAQSTKTKSPFKLHQLSAMESKTSNSKILEKVEGAPEPDYSCDCGAQPQDEELCKVCREIDFEEILSHNRLTRSEVPKDIFNVRHTAGSQCPFCIFLRNCCPTDRDIDFNDKKRLSAYRLKPGRTAPIFNTKKLNDSPALEICYGTSRARSTSRVILPIHANDSPSGRHTKTEEIDVSIIHEWLKICDELHSPCRKTAKHSISNLIPGMRVIDCISMEIVPSTIETAEYVTLSYVWGDQPSGTSESHTLTSLPKVVDDAILLVRKLGMRYLWVDRYCIPQDDPINKAIQIQNMGKVYGDSALTIIAAAGDDADYGLPGVSSTPRISQPLIRIGGYCLTVGLWRATPFLD